MKLIYLAYEGSTIWGAFTKKQDAKAFRKREFTKPYPVDIASCKVYESLSEAPMTDGDALEESAELS